MSPVPVTLAIETSGRIGSVALALAEGSIVERVFPEGTRHGRDLMPSVAALLAEAGVARSDLERIAVSVGPGSFTGLRVGVAAAKTLAWALGAALVAVPTLDVLARGAPPDTEGTIVPVLDARRGHVHAALYSYRSGAIIRATEFLVVPPDRLTARTSPPVTWLGEGLRTYPGLASGGIALEEERWRARAAIVAELGAAAEVDPDREALHALEPLYLRIPTPEERRRAREDDADGS